MKPNLFLGIEISGGRRPFAYVALDSELHLHALGQADLEDMLAFAAGQHSALVGLNAPSRPNLGFAWVSRKSPSAGSRRAAKVPRRAEEHQLQLPGLSLRRTPALENECPPWMRRGFTLYRRLGEIGYQPYPAEDAPRQWLETQAEAIYWALLGKAPLAGENFESRLQRQMVCYDLHLPVSDPMEFFEEITRFRIRQGTLPLERILLVSELNAMIAAYTAWVASTHPEQIYRLGTLEEGEILLPHKPKTEEEN